MKGQLHMDEKRAAQLLGCPERRARLSEFEVRGGEGNTFVVRGYASVADHPYDVYGGPERGGWTETINRGAFDTTLAAKPDVSFLINHDGMPLARTRSGTLVLRADNTGLESEAVVDRRDPFGQALEVKMERGDLDQMSFGFRVTRQEWNDDYTQRGIVEVNLDKGDVSIVNAPANPATSMSIVSARSAIGVLREMELAEARASLGDLKPDDLRQAQSRLGELLNVLDSRAANKVTVGTMTAEVDVVPVLRKVKTFEELRALLLTICDDSGSADDADMADDADESADEDEDDTQVSTLIDALVQLINNSGLVLTPARSGEPEVEVRDEEQVAEVVETATERRMSARLARYKALVSETAA